MENIFTLSGSIIINGIEEAKGQIQNLINVAKDSSSSMEKNFSQIENKYSSSSDKMVKSTKELSSSVQKDFSQIEDNVSSSTNNMIKLFGSLGTAIATAFTLRSIKSFVLELSSTSANVEAELAQMSAAFSNLSSEAKEMIDRVSDSTKVLASRLQVTGTKGFSQFKGAGIEANKALQMTEKFLNAAADGAAYYDKTLEETETRIRSFIRGNTEAGDGVGLYTSEIQRNTKALEMYGQKFIKLTQAQRQMVMLDIVSEIYEQSGAMGQAAREADGWVNVAGNLAEAFRQLKATMGEPIASILIPVMETLARKMTELALWFKENQKAFKTFVDILIIAGSSVAAFALSLGALSILRNVSSLINLVTLAMRGLNATLLSNPIGLVVGTISSLVAGLVVWQKTAKSSTDKLKDSTNSLSSATENYRSAINNLNDDTKELTASERTLYELRANEAAKSALSALSEIAKNYNKTQEELADKSLIKTQYQAQIDGIVEGLNLGKDKIDDKLTEIDEIIANRSKDGKALTEEELLYWTGFSTGLENVLMKNDTDLTKALTNYQKELANVESEISNTEISISETIQNVAMALADEVITPDSISYLKRIDETLYNNIITSAEEYKEQAIKTASEVNEEIEDEISSPEKIFNSAQDSLKKIATIGSILGETYDVSSESISTLEKAIKDLVDVGEDANSELIKSLQNQIESFKETPDVIKDLYNSTLSSMNEIDVLAQVMGYDYDATTNKVRVLESAISNMVSEIVSSGGNVEDNFFLASLKGMLDDLILPMDNLGTIYSNVSNELEIADRKFEILGDDFDINKEKASILESGINALIEAGAGKDNESLKKLLDQLNKLKNVDTKSFSEKFKETANNISDKFKDAMDKVDSYITPLFDSILNLSDTLLQNEINNLEKSLDELKKTNEEWLDEEEKKNAEQKKLLNEQYKAGKIDYATYIKGIKKLDNDLEKNKEENKNKEAEAEKELTKKKDELARNQFNAKKATDIANVWINAATATMMAFAQLGPIGGAIAAITVATTAALQTAAISSQEYTPMLAKGGILDKPTKAIIGEDGAEAVVPLEKNLGWVEKLKDVLVPVIDQGINNAAIYSSSQTYSDGPVIAKLQQIIDELGQKLDLIIDKNQNVYIDSNVVAGAIAPRMDINLGRLSKLKNRGI